jgi:hypothetical protein
VPPERRRYSPGLTKRDVVPLTDIVEHVELHHQMMHAVLARLDHREAVMARIEMEEEGFEGPEGEVAQTEPKQILIERDHRLDALDVQDDVTHAERPGPKAGNRPSGVEWVGRHLGAIERLDPIAGGILEENGLPHAPLIGDGLGQPLDVDR